MLNGNGECGSHLSGGRGVPSPLQDHPPPIREMRGHQPRHCPHHSVNGVPVFPGRQGGMDAVERAFPFLPTQNAEPRTQNARIAFRPYVRDARASSSSTLSASWRTAPNNSPTLSPSEMQRSSSSDAA